MYVLSQSPREIRLTTEAETITRPLGPLQEVGPDDRLVVVIGGAPGYLSFLSGTPTLGAKGYRERYGAQAEFKITRTEWDRLPDSWLGWEAVDAVVLGDAALAPASSAGLEALLTWVRLGGTLVVPGGANAAALAAGPLGGCLPLEVSGTTVVPDLQALSSLAGTAPPAQSCLGSRGRLKPSARALCSAGDLPLVAAGPVGQGQVVMTAFDYTAAPIRYWDAQAALWSRLLVAPAPAPSLL